MIDPAEPFQGQHCSRKAFESLRRASVPLSFYPNMTNRQRSGGPANNSIGLRHWRNLPITVSLVLLALLFFSACAGKPAASNKLSAVERYAVIRQVAVQYAKDRDIAAARSALGKLELANPAQFILTVAEQALNEGKPADEIASLTRLADGLGARSPKLLAYLAPTPTTAPPPAPTNTPAPASPTLAPSATLAPATAAPASPTAAPTTTPTAAPTAEPQKPRVVADTEANLRGGPGTNYPLIGKIAAGKEFAIIGRNTNGDWWRIAWEGASQAWVAGLVVRVLGPIDTVAVAKDIPAPPPTFTPAPPPPPTATPKPAGPDFQLVEVRIWGVVENGGFFDGPSVHCGGNRELHIKAVDAAGAPLNGVTIKAALGAQEEIVTGHKGVPGDAEFVLGGGQEVYVIRDVDGRQVTSDYARGMTTDPHGIPIPTLIGAGYCRDEASCASFINENGCRGHYSWTVTFRRNR